MPDDARHPPVLSPDFADHPPGPEIAGLDIDREGLRITWVDGLTRHFNRFWLRENEVAEGIVNAVTREREIDPDLLPEDLHLVAADAPQDGTVVLTWGPEPYVSRHHRGWLRTAAEGLTHPDAALPPRVTWDAAAMPEPLSFDGPAVLEDDEVLGAWLSALRAYGLARLRNLPDSPGTVRTVAERIGTIRASNFGFTFTVETKPDPDSNAYTSAALTAHTDLASREVQPGLQLLHCRQNTATGGYSTMVDGFRLAEEIRDTSPEDYEALTQLHWVFSNRHPESDYRFSGPIVELDRQGNITEIRNTGFLRSDPDMDESDVPRAYRAVRHLTELSRNPRFVCRYPFAAGDLVIFDNRRILHGRDAFDKNSGIRQLEGCYMERDELYSRLRVLARCRRAGRG